MKCIRKILSDEYHGDYSLSQADIKAIEHHEVLRLKQLYANQTKIKARNEERAERYKEQQESTYFPER